MKKNLTPILLLAGAGAVAYFFLKKSPSLQSQKLLAEGEGEGEQPEPAGKDADITKTEGTPDNTEVDATIDTTKTGGSVATAIKQAKAVSQGIKDIAILIKTAPGMPNILYRKGKKRKKRRTPIRTKKLKRGFRKFRTKRNFV